MERAGVGEAELGESIIIEVCLGTYKDRRWEVGVALSSFRFARRAVDVPPGMAQREVSGSSKLLVLFGLLASVKRHLGGGGCRDVLSTYFLDQGHMFAFVMSSKLFRGCAGLSVGEYEDRISHGCGNVGQLRIRLSR